MTKNNTTELEKMVEEMWGNRSFEIMTKSDIAHNKKLMLNALRTAYSAGMERCLELFEKVDGYGHTCSFSDSLSQAESAIKGEIKKT